MNKTFFLKNLPLLLLGSGVLLTASFAQTTRNQSTATKTDTLPLHEKKIRDLDEALAEIDKGEIEMQKAWKEVDRDKMESQLRKAMKAAELDMARMKEDLARSMKEIDLQKTNAELQKAMKEIDCEKLKKQLNESWAKVDMEKIKAEMEKAKLDLEMTKEINTRQMQKELAGIGPQVEKAMKEARQSMAKAREEITSYKNLVSALDRDGLLNKNGNYTIEYKNRLLTVNGKQLPAEDTGKYKAFLSGKDHFTLTKNEDGLDISNRQ